MAKIATTIKNGQGRKTVAAAQRGFTRSEQQAVEKLAYQFFVDRGYAHGHHQEDWLRAEAVIRNRRS